MRNLKEQKGITLVALVVTIIVLLILAGVTILYVLGDDGIFGTAQRAGTETDDAFVKEVLMTAVLQAQTDYFDMSSADRTVTNKATAQTYVQNQLTAAGITSTELVVDNFYETGTGVKLSGNVEYKDVSYTVSYDSASGVAFTLTRAGA